MPIDPLTTNSTVLCPNDLIMKNTSLILSNSTSGAGSFFERFWDLYSTVPIILSVIMFCVLNFKSPTFFTKFNSLGKSLVQFTKKYQWKVIFTGTISVLYLIIFVAVKAFGWGINMGDWSEELSIKPTFTALSGMLSLSYFIHNIIISIMKNNKHQEHNVSPFQMKKCTVFLTFSEITGSRPFHSFRIDHLHLLIHWNRILCQFSSSQVMHPGRKFITP